MLFLDDSLASLKHDREVNRIAFSPDGKLLATASGDGSAGLWDVISGQRLATLLHESHVQAVAFSPDGSLLATACKDNNARLWNVANGQCLAVLPHGYWVQAVAFSPDGRLLATASEDKTARLWLCQKEDLITEAQSRLNRNLTLEEWQQYLGEEPYHKAILDIS